MRSCRVFVSTDEEDMSLNGNLIDMSLVDIIQVFDGAKKSGVLLLQSNPLRGVIFCCEGRLIDAAIVDGPTRRVVAIGEEAVIQLLQWDEASFVFRPDASVAERAVRIFQDNDSLLLAGMRQRVDPLAALPHQQITLDSRFAARDLPEDTTKGVLMNRSQWRVFTEISSGRNMRDICDTLVMEFHDVARIVAELVAIGLVETIKPAAPAARPALKPIVPQHILQHIRLDEFDVIPRSALVIERMSSRGLVDAVIQRIHEL